MTVKEGSHDPIKKKEKPIISPFPLYKHYPSRFEQIVYQTYNGVENRMWPVRPLYYGMAATAIAAYHWRNPSNYLLNLLPQTENVMLETLKITVLSLGSAYIPVFVIRRFLKHFYFSYKGFLFDNPKKPSITTRIWGIVRAVLSFCPPRLQSCERLLPTQPVPNLQENVAKYLESIKHIVGKDELDLITEQGEKFLKEEGKKLQMYARLYSLFTTNYVSDFWRKYVYLYGRDPLLINSSVAHVDLFRDAPAMRAVRAAHVVAIESLSQMAIHRQNYKPLGDGLLCACHYDNMYAVNRVPGETIDNLVNYGTSNHVAILLKGNIYKMQYCDDRGKMYTLDELTKIFDELFTRAELEPQNGPLAHICALTSDRRDQWHQNRRRFFLENVKNKKALEIIESAVFFFTMDEEDDWDYEANHPEKLDNFMRNMLTGNGSNRWADKSLNYIMNKNTRCGGTTEHSIADGSEFDHIMENFVYMDTKVFSYKPLEEQQKLLSNGRFAKEEGLKLAEKLQIDLVNAEMVTEIERCRVTAMTAGQDVDMATTVYREWGKGRIKKCGCSPDAFVQMAIQLAVYRDQGRFVFTYEPASVRFYRNSRTETLRTVGEESCQFVKAMEDSTKEKSERIKLLKKACEAHVNKNKDCMIGKGIDRHFFVLYVLSKGFGISSPFLETIFSQKWFLSTSHVPNVTGQIDEDKDIDFSWIGACFGAVTKDGYGICYRFAGNHSICAHISSYHSAENTDSHRFQREFIKALNEMAEMFE
ncbi:unnamed protein product, partial [Mesorhabditis belari]|uniref:Choline/carnitine acyltransferase domain-containing protein n=1 Tax=Mesorhabditis belari TaxID=2138241 RepID=A0AAF3FSF7_9BILA